MAVYKRAYRGYSGTYTPQWSRFLVLTRYAYRGLFRSRIMLGMFVVCLFPFLFCVAALYLNHNTSILSALKIRGIGPSIFQVDQKFFTGYLGAEFGLAFLLTAFIGPGLISPDLANNGLPLYLCRPFSRTEYVLGKFMVIAALLSYITWVPALVLFIIESSLAGAAWMWSNLWMARAIFLGSWILILVLAFIALALSAWVKWKPIAGALVLGVMFLGAGLGAAVNAIMRTTVGNLINVGVLVRTVWQDLFRVTDDMAMSPLTAWLALIGICAICIALLARKIRAFEVVK
jgi:ABC-2 type transport system permease protein